MRFGVSLHGKIKNNILNLLKIIIMTTNEIAIECEPCDNNFGKMIILLNKNS